MTSQIETKEQVRWEDLEVVEEQIEDGWGLSPLQLIVNGPEWITARDDVECVEYFDPKCGVDLAKSHSEFTALTESARNFASANAMMQGVLLVFSIPAEEFAEAMEGRARAALEQELRFAEIPIIASEDMPENHFRFVDRANRVKWLDYIAQCTPSRNTITGQND